MPSITHVIFDVDGLLLDTEPLIAAIASTIAGRYGKTLDQETLSLTAGRNAQDSAQILVDRLALPLTCEDYLAEKAALVPQMYPKAEAKPGARQLVEHLRIHGIPQAIATSSSQQHFDLKKRHHPWMNLFSCVVTGEDPELAAGKPAPDIFLLAAQRLGASPDSCLVMEDSLAGVTAARAADMAVVAVPELPEFTAQYSAADQVLTSLLEFKPSSWRLPPYKQD
ncbi:MAG: HAD-IA family hydrolase [Cyanobacteria bacterium P01_A01_bin.135]